MKTTKIVQFAFALLLVMFLSANGFGMVNAKEALSPMAQTSSVRLIPSTPGYGCSFWPYVQCSASWVITQSSPDRIDYDITFSYADDMTNMPSTFTFTVPLHVVDDVGNPVYYTDVPIWWVMYPVTNEIMPTRRIHVQFPTTPQYLDPMSSPSGLWIIPAQPSPYNTVWIEFERQTTDLETLIRTDTWHLTVATDFVVCYGSSCNGLNPETMGCGNDAQMYNFIYLYDQNGIGNFAVGQVQNKFSVSCMAQWEKTLNTSGNDMYAEGSIRWGSYNYSSGWQRIQSYGKIASAASVYTPMYGVDTGLGPSLNCGNLSYTTRLSPPAQPINPVSYYFTHNCFAR